MHQAKVRLTENSTNPAEFIRQYDELKGRNVKDLDALVFFLSEISDKPEVNKPVQRCLLMSGSLDFERKKTIV